MADQSHLFNPPAPTGNLTPRQRHVYALLRQHTATGGLEADEVGAELHEEAGKHDAGVRCQWCQPTGMDVLKALRRKGLARRTRAGGWRALQAPAPESTPDPKTTDPFPEGY